MTIQNESDRVTCSNPIDAVVLADYWLGLLGGVPLDVPLDVKEEAVEEHLLSCDRCGERLREVIALADGVRRLAREGGLRMVVSDAFRKRAAEEGLRVREYDLPPGGGVQCTVTAEDDILIGRFAGDFRGAKRVDICFYDERGIEQHRLIDIPIHSGATNVAYQESITFAKAAPTSRMMARLVSVDDAGEELLLGAYTFNHTRSLPGPGEW